MAARSSRRTSTASCAVVSLLLGLVAYLGLSTAFSLLSGRAASSRSDEEDVLRSRREFLAGAAALAAAGSAAPMAAQAAEIPFLGKTKGPFEIDPKDVMIIGNVDDPKIVQSKKEVETMQANVEGALVKLRADKQADLMYLVEPFGIADLREATTAINNIMDPPSAAGVQRLQRLMIQCRYAFEDDIPFPSSKKGVVQPRGEKRAERIEKFLSSYIGYSTELLKFLP